MKFKVAIIGAGPSGYFVAQALQGLQDSNTAFSIDMIERLPTPWGLVRSGAAPDRQKIRAFQRFLRKLQRTKTLDFLAMLNLEWIFY